MVKIISTMTEGLRVDSEFVELGDHVYTDVVKKFGGHGEKMGPTEMLAASLGSCVLVMMGLAAKRVGLDLAGTTVEIDKVMVQDPHLRVGRMNMVVKIPLEAPEESVKKEIEEAGYTCPIHRSLSSDVEKTITIEWA